MGGIATIPFMDIRGKSLPSTLRGRFFGHRQFWGGIFAVGAGSLAAVVLSHKETLFPKNLALLFLFAFVRNFLLDIAPAKNRPTYVGVNGSLTVIVASFPLTGGVVVQNISYGFLFMLTFVIVFIGFILSLQLKESRATANEKIIS